jgi:hypothetical protein
VRFTSLGGDEKLPVTFMSEVGAGEGEEAERGGVWPRREGAERGGVRVARDEQSSSKQSQDGA